ncbi:MAG: hypothetical protein V4543_08445 [Bacteroidota bacterium]
MKNDNMSVSERELYEYLREAVPEVVISHSSLRDQMALSATKSLYEFKFTGVKDLPNVMLAQTDLFLITGMKLGIVIEDATKPGTGLVTPYGKYRDHDLVYKGQSSFQIGQQVLANAIPNSRFREVKTSQSTYAKFSGTVPPFFDEFEFETGLYRMLAPVLFNGAQSNVVRINVPVYDGINYLSYVVSGNTEIPYLVPELHGLIIPGGVEAAKAVDAAIAKWQAKNAAKRLAA